MKRGMYLPWVRKSATRTSKIASVNTTSTSVFRPVWDDQSAIMKVLEQEADKQAELQKRKQSQKFRNFPRPVQSNWEWWEVEFWEQNDRQ